MAAWLGRTWRSFRALNPLLQIPIAIFGGLFAVSVAAAPFADPDETSVVTAASSTTTTAPEPTTTALPTTTTVSPPTTTAAPTTTVPPPTTAPPTTVRAVSTTRATAPATTRATTAAVVTTVPARSSTGECHPSYVGACLPVDASDVDCAGGSGNGPVYTSAKNIGVVGPDEYGLDGNDNDGIGCER